MDFYQNGQKSECIAPSSIILVGAKSAILKQEAVLEKKNAKTVLRKVSIFLIRNCYLRVPFL